MLGSVRSALMVKGTAITYPNPIASYSFTEGSGTTTIDNSGNGHTATLGSTSLWSASGHTGNCLSNVALSTSASVPSAGWLPTTAITVMAWVFRTNWGQTNKRAVGIWAPGHVDEGFILGASRGSSAGPMVVITTTNTNSLVLQPNQTVLATGWHHLAGTYDGVTMALYVDGIQTGSRLADGILTLDATDNWLLGAGGGGGVLDGQIDDVRMYNIALTPAQIAGLKDIPVS
ncbi:MAG TPA: LamG domain-containing protein [Candidatus Saccharimonadales bacterium]|nr:LamG domain-containing protein [Candidatus Saccharimonadales bacterium]